MTAPRLTSVLALAGLLLVAWAATAAASVPYPQGFPGPPMQMPMKVGPTKCAPPQCAPPACGPVSYAAPPCPPPMCGPPPCPPQMGNSIQGAGCGSGGTDGFRSCLGQVLGVIALPFTLLEKILCSEPKNCPPECPPVMCGPPPCGPMAFGPPPPPAKAKRIKSY